MKENFRLLKPYWRGFPIIILFMIIGFYVAKTYLNYTTTMYESTAKLKLADLDEGVPSNNLFKELDVFSSANKIAGEIEVLKSQLLINRVIEELDFNIEIFRVGQIKSVEIYDNSPFFIKYYNLKQEVENKDFYFEIKDKKNYSLTLPTLGKTVRGELGSILNTEIGTFFISLNDSVCNANPNLDIADTYKFIIYSPQKSYQNISKNLNITSVAEDVPVIRITYKNANPKKTARIVNKIAEAYIDDYINTKYRAANLTVNFLRGQIDSTIVRIAKSENQIQTYRDTMFITNIVQETETDLRAVSQLKIQLTNIEMSLRAINELNDYITKGKDRFLELAPNFEAFTDLLSTEIIKKIKQLQSDKRDLLLIYTHKDERVKVIDEKIKDLTQYLVESINNTRKNLESKRNLLAKDIVRAESEFIGVPGKERVLMDLNREFNIYQQTYNFLNEKKIEAEIAAAAKISFHKIISPGDVPQDPVSPNKTIIVIISALLGMFSSVLLIFIVHQIKAKVNDAITIETNSSVPIALLIPKLYTKKDLERIFLKSAIELELKGLADNNTMMCFTSFEFEDRAEFNAFHLARAFAFQNRKVLLIDVSNQYGYFQSVENVSSKNVEGIDIEHLSHPKFKKYTFEEMKAHFNELKSKYDVVIVLNEALVRANKANMIMSIADVNMFVVDARNTSKRRITEFELLKEEYEFSNMYFILNRHNFNPSILRDIYNLKNIDKYLKYFKLKSLIVIRMYTNIRIFFKNILKKSYNDDEKDL